MKAIILAAGQGTRLKKYTQDLPKGMLMFAGKTLIERQIEAYRATGIETIIIIRGFAAEKIAYDGITYYTNKAYAETNMVESLLTAREEFDDDIIVSYSDIVFERQLLDGMIAEPSDFVVAVDDAWKEYWKKRYGKIDFDTESLSIGADGTITELGKENPPLEDIDARYIGVLKFSRKGLKYITELIDEAKAKMGADEPWQQSGKPIRQAYMTDLLNAIIESGQQVKAVRFQHGWLEFDTNEDYENAIRWKEEREIKDLIRLDESNYIQMAKNYFVDSVQWKKIIPSNLGLLLDILRIPIVASVSSNPVLANSIDMAFLVSEGILHKIEVENIKTMLLEYVDRKIDEKLDANNPIVQEFFKHTVLKVTRCSKSTQVRRIMDVFQAALEGDIISYNEAEDYINIISEMSESEAILLAKIYRYFQSNPNIQSFSGHKVEIFEGLPENSWDYLINRLEGKGLLNSEPTAVSDEDFQQMMDGIQTSKMEVDTTAKRDGNSKLTMNSKTYFPNAFGKQLFRSINNRN